MASEDDIQETFYNSMISLALEAEKYEALQPEILKSLMLQTLRSFCNRAVKVTLPDGSSSFGFSTLRGAVITISNVPATYAELFGGLVAALASRSSADVTEEFDRILNILVERAITRPQFGPIIARFTTFYIELTAKVVEPVVSVPVIRETFYNIMVDEYFSNMDAFKSDVENLESYIFICLSARAAISILSHSLHVQGIRLYNNALVVPTNCPAEYQQMFERLWTLKTLFDRIKPSPDVLELIHQTVSMRPGADAVSPTLLALKTPQISEIIGIISELAIGVSRMQHFKEIIGEVLRFCSNL